MPLPLWFQILVFVPYGLVLGSFATALAWRVPRNQSWAMEKEAPKADQDNDSPSEKTFVRSHCPQCKHMLGIRDLLPVFSWLSTKGRCRYCHQKIGRIYPLTELANVVLALGVLAVYGLTPAAFVLAALLPFLTALLLIDLRYLILPDQLILIPFLIGVGFMGVQYFFPVTVDIDGMTVYPFGKGALALQEAVLSAGLYAVIVWLAGKLGSFFIGRAALGFGDVKLFALAGLWLGLLMMPAYFIMAGCTGVLWGILWRWRGGEKAFPFGPALIVSFYICLLVKPFFMV